uniref:DUF5615 domain-containing protein n=1 Tax=Candidatus Kentrum sp. DK TaxID=2126562 RepID=A0A450SPJ5_9GAMM|nr:MAG: hypothetical protein BECKDK2373C_GA0170839_10509 [Candidatus Kentron sp. DK]
MPPRKVLLDECMPREFARYITGHEVRTVQAVGWKSIKNGDLLRLAQTDFDVFITADRKLIYHQDPGKFDIAIIVLRERSLMQKSDRAP